jgi:hypothetical protein
LLVIGDVLNLSPAPLPDAAPSSRSTRRQGRGAGGKELRMTLDTASVRNERRGLLEERILIRFSLFGTGQDLSRAGLGSLRVMVFEPADGRRSHTWARPLTDGFYEVVIPAPGSGPCYLFFASPKAGVWYADLPHLILQTSVEGIAVIRRLPDAAPADRCRAEPVA